MSISGMIGGWFVGQLAELALEEGARGLWRKIKDQRARKALAGACASALETAVTEAPALAEDLRSESFRGGVALPLVRGLLENPATLVSAETFASHYLDMFVERYGGAQGADSALARIFQTDRATLLRAFERFLEALKASLYASDHWREAQHYLTTEAIAAQVGRIATLLDERQADARAASVDLDHALRDAAVASAEMRAWPSEIRGMWLQPPALERLVARIVTAPSQRTLLVGEAGAGKSALLARLAPALEAEGVTVFAIKADLLPTTLVSLDDLAVALGVDDGLEDRIAALAAERPVALLLDQLDAVSDVMDRQSNRMRLLLQLVHRLGARERAGDPPLRVHVLVSSRPFEAAHDARFQQLKAETIRLDKLEEAQVGAVLEHLGFDPAQVDAALLQTLRRPFALKLFADIIARGAGSRDLSPACLLDAWLATADLGTAQERRETGSFLSALAEEMIVTETLWRPADTFDLAHAGAVQRAEAAGLILRSGGKIGFSHQSWLDDFQAKAFRTGSDLAEYAWARQDSLFVRASILRALERLRVRDSHGYEAALRALLGGSRTRRHILHLIADIVATASDPLPFEIGWIDHWLRNDVPIAARALRLIIPRWHMWRDSLRDALPIVMMTPSLHWHAARMLAGEVRFDADHVARLVDRCWNEPDQDLLVFEILEQSGFVGLDVEARLQTIFARTPIDDHMISHLARTLRAEARYEEAATIVALWLAHQEIGRTDRPKIYELEKLVEAAPLAVARKLLPWFLEMAARDVETEHAIVARFPRSLSLPYGWEFKRAQGSPFEALHQALALLGEQDPEALWELLAPIASVEIDDVQELIAVGLTAAGPALARTALDFLLTDTRRFQISHIIAGNQDGVIGPVEGWHSQQLIRAIVPGLDAAELAALRDAIERWSYYTDSALADDKLAGRRGQTLNQRRFPLLAALPMDLFDMSRAAQLAEWRAGQPKTETRPGKAELAGWVGPPMTHEEMADASDSEIHAALDEFHDGSGEHRWTRPISRSGGVRELSRAFGAFGKVNPQRALSIVAGLEPNRHERAAGALVRDLGDADGVEPSLALQLVVNLDGRGFASRDWREDAASALQKLAGRMGGLDDAVITLLESWIESDPERIAMQLAERLAFEAGNPRDRGLRDQPHPILFGAGGGVAVLPNNNFTILSAIAAGLLCRKEPDCDAWAAALERHVERPEDPVIWSALLTWRGEYLSWADPERVSRLLERTHERFPEAWQDVQLTRFLWLLRPRIPDDLLIATMVRWMVGDDACRQAAGELLTAAHLVEPEAFRYDLLFKRLDRSVLAIETGVLFSASAAWIERDPALRPAAHALLIDAIASAHGPAAHALSCALGTRPELIPDLMTRELLAVLPDHPAVLRASVTHFFTEALQGLLFYPGFDEVILAVVERIASFIIESRQHGMGLRGEELVRVAIALQRSDGPLRSRAMDVYEGLLDAAVYGADEASKASLSR